ncbi:MAG: DUF3293 domain-containing protein [Chitinophagales bacterium]|nr:DUF3293 domain-containing protein [Chitinophagales bacterium]
MIIYITSEQALDASLQAAYEQAEYRIFVSGEEWIMRQGEQHGELENWLEERGFVSLAIVTAYNPGSVLLEEAENRQRNAAMEQVLQELALPYGPALNQAPDGGWQEPGFWVAGIGLEAAVALGREFGQAAIWWGHREVRKGR